MTMNDAVRQGYGRIAETYVGQRDAFKSVPHLERFAVAMPERGRVLDIGCGGGVPVASWLVARGFDVHGIDISPRMIDIARANAPGATFTLADMSMLAPGAFSADGIVSFYAIFHTPKEGHRALLGTLVGYLSPGGVLLITRGASVWEGTEDFHGAAMSWSHFDAATNRDLVESAGLRVVVDEIDESGDERHHIIMAVRER